MQRKLRLRNRADFNRVYRGGRSFANSQFVVYWSKHKLAEPFRLGVSVSKKVGNAVVRNRMKRVVKEIVRRYEGKIAPHTDLIIIVRKPAIVMKFTELEKSIAHVLRKAGLLTTKSS